MIDRVEVFLVEELDAYGLADLVAFRRKTGVLRSLEDKEVLSPSAAWQKESTPLLKSFIM